MQEIIKNTNNTFVGIDCGKRTMVLVRLNSNGDVICRTQLKTDFVGQKKLLNWITKNDTVAIEAGNLSFLLTKLIKSKIGNKVIILNPGKLQIIYNSLKKTDKEDALKLARIILRNPKNELPEVSLPSEKEEEARRLASEQAFYTNNKTALINRLHSEFVHCGITDITKKDLKNKKKREKLIETLNENYLKSGRRLLKQIIEVETILEELDDEIKSLLKDDLESTSIMMSVPGIGPINSLVISGFIGTQADRFSNAAQVSNYSGLVPRVDISSDTIRYGKIVKGNMFVKRVIVQAAYAMIKSKYGIKFKNKYTEIVARRGKKKAIIAIARKMIELVYILLKNREYYNDMPKESLIQKMEGYGLC